MIAHLRKEGGEGEGGRRRREEGKNKGRDEDRDGGRERRIEKEASRSCLGRITAQVHVFTSTCTIQLSLATGRYLSELHENVDDTEIVS